jgi:hypothetical protein
MALTYLKQDRATRLEIEVDYVSNRELPDSSQSHLLGILNRELNKPDGIDLRIDDELGSRGSMAGGGGDATYTLEEIHRLARMARDAWSGGQIATAHVVILDGASQEVPGALGIAINGSTAILFADRIDDASAPLVGAAAIWKSVTVHEFGHLLGLVEILERSGTDRHQDPAHPGHSTNEDSVMYWAIEDVGIVSILGKGPPQDFDVFDRYDLARLRD